MKILITGRAGSGKSTVAAELKRRGYTAFDTDDVPSLSSWKDKKTNQLVTLADNSFVDLARYRWVWSETEMQRLLDSSPTVFVCGGADNDFSFEHSFNQHFVLDVSPDIQIKRLGERTSNDYGKDPRMFPIIIEQQAEHVRTARYMGAAIVDANLPVDAVVDSICNML